MNASKIALSGLAILSLAGTGVAQAESIRAGASLPALKTAKLSRKIAKKGVELNQAGPDSTIPILLGVGGVAAGVGIGVAVTRKSP
jgi:hypothetical protein